MVPADRALYALRDVTGTVPSIPLIVASILSKKLAEGLDALVLDVKYGTAAFMQTPEKAFELARDMVDLGKQCGVRTRAVLTPMSTPSGRAAGNWLEVVESVAILEGKGPTDVTELVLNLAAHLLVLTGLAPVFEQGLDRAKACIASGQPREKWNQMLAAQGADLDAFHRQLTRESSAGVTRDLLVERSGFVSTCDARVVGEIIRDLGGGRLTKDDKIDYAVGIDRLAKPGDAVSSGSLLARVHAPGNSAAETALARLARAFTIADQPPAPDPLILRTVE
jgi:thymidine phosphorylase